jgi:hypothetical protein
MKKVMKGHKGKADYATLKTNDGIWNTTNQVDEMLYVRRLREDMNKCISERREKMKRGEMGGALLGMRKGFQYDGNEKEE